MNTLRYWVSLTGTTALVLLTAFALVGGNLAASQPVVHAAQRTTRSNTAAQPRGDTLPAGLVPIVARTLAARSPDTWRTHVTKQALVFNNPAQHLTARFNRVGAQLQFKGKQHAELGMQLLALYRGSVSYPMTAATPSAHGNRVELNHGHGLIEWYVNNPLGVEQGFTIAAPPKSAATSQSLALVFKLNGNLTPALKNNTLAFQNAKGQTVLRYGDLLAYDARHHALPARMQLKDSRLLLHVNTEGARYPLTIDPLFSNVASYTDPSGAAGDTFGYAVAISGDGSTALIGANGTSIGTGTAYVYSQINGVWSTAPIQTFNDPSATQGDNFGGSVALSADGTIALIGADGFNSSKGAAYLYAKSSSGAWPTTPTTTFTDPAKTNLDIFGDSVSLSGDGKTALIGADGAELPGTNTTAGVAYIFTEGGSGWPTTPTASFDDPAPAASGDTFGNAVALSADGKTALIGADQTTLSTPGAGTAYVFVLSNSGWPTTPTQSFEDPAPQGNSDFFGYSVALSANGTTALIGAAYKAISGNSDEGAAYLYTASDNSWSVTTTQNFNDPLASGSDFFGASVALSANGTTALIGAFGTTVGGGTFAGATYVYVQGNAGTWPAAPSFSINDPNVTGNDNFGFSAALSSDGSTAVIGADGTTVSANNGAGAAYILAPSADLSLALTSNPASVGVNGSVAYMLTVTNNDTQATATSLTLTDALPAGMTYVSNTAAGGTCANASGTVTCTLASLAPGATWQPSITVTATTAGSINDSATVSSNTFDPKTSNNTATVTTTVTSTPAPTASNGSVTTTAGTAVNGTLAATGSGTLTFAIVAQPKNGAVTLTNASTGAFTYTPNSGFSGTDSFTFTASNSSGTSNTATETVTVNAAGGGSSGGGSSGGGSSGGGSSGGGGGGAFGWLSLLLLAPLVRFRKRKV